MSKKRVCTANPQMHNQYEGRQWWRDSRETLTVNWNVKFRRIETKGSYRHHFRFSTYWSCGHRLWLDGRSNGASFPRIQRLLCCALLPFPHCFIYDESELSHNQKAVTHSSPPYLFVSWQSSRTCSKENDSLFNLNGSRFYFCLRFSMCSSLGACGCTQDSVNMCRFGRAWAHARQCVMSLQWLAFAAWSLRTR